MKNPESNNNSDAAETKTGWESLSTENFIKEQNHNFEGERNINDKTGKERTFVQWDLYPKLKGETNEQYGARLRFMNQKTAEYEAEQAAKAAAEEANSNDPRSKEYLSSEHGKKELAEEEKFDRLTEKVEKAIAEGRMSAEHGKALLEHQLERSTDEIEGYRQDYEDSKVVGTPEEQDAYEKWLKSHDAENQENLQKRESHEELNPVADEASEDVPDETSDEAPEETSEESSEETPEGDPNTAEKDVEEAIEEAVEEKPSLNLDPEVQYWLDEELKDLDEWAEKKKYSEERKAEVKEELEARANEKQTALEAEKAAAIERERAEAAEKERIEAEAREKLLNEIDSIGEEIKDLKKELLEKQIAEKEKEIALVDEAIDQVKKNKRPSIGLIAWLSSRFGKNRRKAKKPTEAPAEKTTEARTFDDDFDNSEEVVDSSNDYYLDLDMEDLPTSADFEKEKHHFWTSIGEKGLDIMTATGSLTDDKEKEIVEWWDSLDDKSKGTITDFKYTIGKPLRTFLQKKEIIPEDTGDYFNEEKADAKRLAGRAEHLKKEYDYWNMIGDEGLRYLTHEEVPNDDNKERVLTWWASLNDDIKDRIADSPLNRKLVTWIREQLETSKEVAPAA